MQKNVENGAVAGFCVCVLRGMPVYAMRCDAWLRTQCAGKCKGGGKYSERLSWCRVDLVVLAARLNERLTHAVLVNEDDRAYESSYLLVLFLDDDVHKVAVA